MPPGLRQPFGGCSDAMSSRTSADPRDPGQELEVLDLNEGPVQERRWGAPPTRVVRFWMLIFAGAVVAVNQVGSWVGAISGNALAVKVGIAVIPWAWSFLIMAGASYIAPARLAHVLQSVASKVTSADSTPAQPAPSNVQPGPR